MNYLSHREISRSLLALIRPAAFIVAVLALRMPAVAKTPPTKPLIPPNSFGQAQSFIADLDGVPMVSGNWEGRFRPYRLAGEKLVPLITPSAGRGFEDYDFYSPTPLGGGVLMSAQKLGQRKFDLVFYDLKKHTLRIVTTSPRHDEGSYCVSPAGLVAFRQDRTEQVARFAGGRLKVLAARDLPGFERCLWLDAQRFIGATGLHAPLTIHDCSGQGANWTCRQTPLGPGLREFVGFYSLQDGETGLLGLSAGDEFRRVYAFDPDLTRMAPSPKNPQLAGDALEAEGDFVRLGHRSRYWAAPIDDSGTTIFRLKKIGSAVYSIAANEQHAKTLAILADGRWQLLRPPNSQMVLPRFAISEIWLRSPEGSKFQAFYFGDPAAKNFVLWLHGGPRENVSPRFNPYFAELNARNFAVLALNYPGSTGRGRAYELQSEDPAALRQAAAAAFAFFAQRKAERIVGWSVSAGGNRLLAMLQQGFPFTALVDQAGFPSEALQRLAKSEGIPLLSIRGQNDIRSDEKHFTFDYVYAGGHDITFLPDFHELFRRFDLFQEISSAH